MQNPQWEIASKGHWPSIAGGREDTCGWSTEEPPNVDDLAGGELLPGMSDAVAAVAEG